MRAKGIGIRKIATTFGAGTGTVRSDVATLRSVSLECLSEQLCLRLRNNLR